MGYAWGCAPPSVFGGDCGGDGGLVYGACMWGFDMGLVLGACTWGLHWGLVYGACAWGLHMKLVYGGLVYGFVSYKGLCRVLAAQ